MRPLLCLAAFLIISFPAVAGTGARITDLHVIPLQRGINRIPRLTPDGRDGEILKAWRENGNGRGYHLFLVLLKGKVVGIANGGEFQDYMVDYPHTFDDAVKSVRFAWGKVGGQKEMLLITATREIKPSYSIPDPARVVFDIYQVVSNGAIGTTGDFFSRISEFKSKKKYCNADLALAQNLGLPLPDPYQGPNQDDGCF